MSPENYIAALNTISNLTSENNLVATDVVDVRWYYHDDMHISSYGSCTDRYSNPTDVMLILLKAIRDYESNGVLLRDADAIFFVLTTGNGVSFDTKEKILETVGEVIQRSKTVDMLGIFESDQLGADKIKLSIVGLSALYKKDWC